MPCICHRPWCDKEPQGYTHSKLPCCMLLWSSFHVFFIWLGGTNGRLYAFPSGPSKWLLHSKGEVLPCRCWLCLIGCTAGPLLQCAVPIIWMGSCQGSVSGMSFLKSFSLTFFQVHTTPKSCIICITCQLAMWLSRSLGSSSGAFESSSFLHSMTCKFRPLFLLHLQRFTISFGNITLRRPTCRIMMMRSIS